ncbi:hypothetical protein SpCBS45565_g08310 [Spizellomyces sp. 'palustris']|nr:hypothetical protein SpCBS45565_g08310 [Spizellomyces sp. 'palustris']
MDFAYLDTLLACSKRLDKDLQDLVTTLSLPTSTPNADLHSSFIAKNQQRCDTIAKAVEAMEKDTGGKTGRRPSAEELVDAASDAALQMQRQCTKVMEFLKEYGYEEQGAHLGEAQPQPVARPAEPPVPSISHPPTLLPDGHQSEEEVEPPSSPQIPITMAIPTTPRAAGQTGTKKPARSAAASPPDSPLATLEDFGLSSLSLGLLEVTDTPSSEGLSFHSHPIKRESIDSPAIPIPDYRPATWSQSPRKPRKSDPNSMFNALIALAGREDYEALPQYLKAQMTLEFLNDMITGMEMDR